MTEALFMPQKDILISSLTPNPTLPRVRRLLLDKYIQLAIVGFVIHNSRQSTSFLKEKWFKMEVYSFLSIYVLFDFVFLEKSSMQEAVEIFISYAHEDEL